MDLAVEAAAGYPLLAVPWNTPLGGAENATLRHRPLQGLRGAPHNDALHEEILHGAALHGAVSGDAAVQEAEVREPDGAGLV